MASDSVVGAVGENLSSESLSLLEQVVAQITGTAAYFNVGGATAVFGAGEEGTIVGTLPAGSSSVSGEFRDTNFVANVVLPSNTGINFQGPSANVSAEAAADYFSAMIEAALPSGNGNPAVQAKAQSLNTAVDVVKNSGSNSDITVRYVEVISASQSDGAGNVTIAGGGASDEVVAINASQLGTNQQLVLQDLEKVIIVNNADVVVTGTNAAMVVGDNADQKITGGQGADTLVGGGGSDTLVGGAGIDSFGFVSGGTFTIGDFNAGEDKLVFDIAGITSFSQLASLVTGSEETAAGVTYFFGDAGSISLVGVSPSDVTEDLITFTLVTGV